MRRCCNCARAMPHERRTPKRRLPRLARVGLPFAQLKRMVFSWDSCTTSAPGRRRHRSAGQKIGGTSLIPLPVCYVANEPNLLFQQSHRVIIEIAEVNWRVRSDQCLHIVHASLAKFVSRSEDLAITGSAQL